MNTDKREYDLEEFETACCEMISKVLFVCEAEYYNRNRNENALSYAAMSVRESILTFLSLVKKE